MKTLFALLGFCLLSLAAFADRKPTVIINGDRDFEVVIDGRRITNDNLVRLTNLRSGRHTVKVYRVTRGLFNSRRTLVSTSSFRLRNDDVYINIDRRGQANVKETDNRNWRNDRNDRNDRNGRNDRNDRYERDRDWGRRY